MGKSARQKKRARNDRLARAKEIFGEHPDHAAPDFLFRYCRALGVDDTVGSRDLAAWGIAVSKEQEGMAREKIKEQSERRRAKIHAVHAAGDCAVKGKKYCLPHDDKYCCILGERGGRPYGITWEEVGVDPALPLQQKTTAFLEQNAPRGWKSYEHHVMRSGGRPTKRLQQHWEGEMDSDFSFEEPDGQEGEPSREIPELSKEEPPFD
ncbi:MAG: hypothetical protein ACI4OJ_12885 [Lachnospiraceae bacterium]